jgi:8-oxo-dGTP pyrophosphatase MutT (NUDIX family)
MGDDHELLQDVRAFFASGRRQDTHSLRPDMQASDLSHIREASVLIPFHSPAGIDEPHILLTLRPEYLRSHAGQVSLPGGRREAHDESSEATAVRESEEEIGASAHQIEVIGELGAVYMPSGYRITPFVGVLAPDTDIRPCPVEVEAVFHAPASLLLDPDNYQRSTMVFRDREREILELQYGEYRIWGATAAILHGFGQAIRKHRT